MKIYETPFKLADDIVELYNDYLKSIGRSDKQFVSMDEFDIHFKGYRPSEIVSELSEDFDIDDDYFRDTNDYGKVTSWEESDAYKQIEDEVESSEDFLDFFLNSIDLYDFWTSDLFEILNDCENAGLYDWVEKIDEILEEYNEEED